MPNVAYDTAYVVAHTVGADRVAVVLARRSNSPLPVEVFSADKPHPNEALIGWVAQQLAAGQRAVRKEQATQEQYSQLVFKLEEKLPQIAVWAANTKPNLSAVSVDQAISEASAFEPPESDAPVPQGEVIYRFADGWTVQNLTTPEQIFAEGLAVQNCLREEQNGPNYAKDVKKGKTQIMSLRTPQGRPAVSIEYIPKRKEFAQVYAKQNTALGATLESLKSDGVKDAEKLWASIQRYKPRIRELIVEKFDGNVGGLMLSDVPLVDGVKHLDRVDFHNYTCRLPDSVEKIEALTSLERYQYPLPSSLKHVGKLFLTGYSFPVSGFSVESLFVFQDYRFPLEGITNVAKSLVFALVDESDPRRLRSYRRKRGKKYQPGLAKYQWPIPKHFKLETVDWLGLEAYNYPLPAKLKRIKGTLDLRGYDFMLPDSLKSVGALVLDGYMHPIPPSLSEVKRRLDLVGYPLEFPEHLKSVGLVSVVDESLSNCPYPFSVPSGFQTDTEFERQSHTYPPTPESSSGKRSGRKKSESDASPHVEIVGIEEIRSNLPFPEGTEVIGLSDEAMAYAKLRAEKPWDLFELVPQFSLVGYSHPLPSTLKKINANVNLYGYDYPLPSSLKKIDGELTLNCYNHRLPRGLEARSLQVGRYGLSIPVPLIRNASDIALFEEAPKLPAGIRVIEGDLRLQGYRHPLPADIEIIGGNLRATQYSGILSPRLKKIGGNIFLGEQSAPLPESLESVGGSVLLDEYTHRLPESR
jgi:hypothetical protein